MLLTDDTMRFLLLACLVCIALLAILFLRQRQLTMVEYIGWGLLIVLVPFLGPFLVILLRPGKPAPRDTEQAKSRTHHRLQDT